MKQYYRNFSGCTEVEMDCRNIIEKLQNEQTAEREELLFLLENLEETTERLLHRAAAEKSREQFGNRIYLRGLIEYTNYCKNNCFYCGIRNGNRNAQRYRLDSEDILACCRMGYGLGYRTFVLQGGEDAYFTDERMTGIVRTMKQEFPDCAVTLSLGERSRESYQALFDAGADRYLLREETSTKEHYELLHPKTMNMEHRLKCLETLKEIGYQTGCGFMVGSPGWRMEYLADELLYIKKFGPHMVGIGPFIPHKDTKYAKEPKGSLALTLDLVAVLRLMNPKALLPATTAVGTLDPMGREKAILAGANVVMPNLSPVSVRKKYILYDNKICTGDEAAECRKCLERRIGSIGYELVTDRGDYPEWPEG